MNITNSPWQLYGETPTDFTFCLDSQYSVDYTKNSLWSDNSKQNLKNYTTFLIIQNKARETFPALENIFSPQTALLNRSTNIFNFNKIFTQYLHAITNNQDDHNLISTLSENEVLIYSNTRVYLFFLGFKSTHTVDQNSETKFFFKIPKVEYLLAKYQELSQKLGLKRDIKIFESEDEIVDAKFIDLFFKYDVVISKNERLHDYMNHLTTLIAKIIFIHLFPKRKKLIPQDMYELSEKTTFFESIYKDYQDILLIKQHKIEIENFGEEHLKLATTLVSAKCDIASTHFYSPPEKYSKLSGAWISYFQKRYPSLEITSSLLDKVMDKCRAAAADYWLKN